MTASMLETSVLSAVIVDDTPDIRMLLKLALERDGDVTVVAEAENGLAGVEAAGRNQPDVVLLDLAMPVMDGLEALPIIRRVCPGARVVVLSGFEAQAMSQKAMAAGADGYLQKGTSPAKILEFIRAITHRDPPPGAAAALPGRPADPAPVTPLRPGDPPAVAAEAAAGPVAGPAAAERAAALAPYGLVLLPGALLGHPVVGFCNPRAAEILGTPEDLTGRDASLALPALSALVARRLSDLLAGATCRDRLVTPSGRMDVELHPDGDDVVVALSAPVATDDAQRLRQAINTTAHEIRNPVTVLVGVAGVMKDRGDDLGAEQRGHLLDAVVRQATLLDRVTEDLLTAAQAQRGSLHVACTSVELAPVLQDVAADRPEATVTVVDAEGVRVLADPTRLTQMVSNLVSNAVKYGAAPITLRVRRGQEPGRPMVHIDVEDRGPGVSEAFRAKLFEEFTRDGGTRAPGTGLGLFVVRSLAEAQDGWADYAPREGGGSVFTITLPDAQRLRPVRAAT